MPLVAQRTCSAQNRRYHFGHKATIEGFFGSVRSQAGLKKFWLANKSVEERMKGILLAAAAASAAFVAWAPVMAAAQVTSGPNRYATVADPHARSVTHFRRTPRFYVARPGDFITNFSSSEHVAVNHPPKNR
jgi:hypothetical protein